MAMISSEKDISQFLDILLKKLGIEPKLIIEIKYTLVPALQSAGGIENDPKDIEKLRKAVLAAALIGRVAGKEGLSFQNAAAISKNAMELVALNFKDPEKLTPEEKRKYSMGMGYLLVLEKNPEADISLALALKDPKTLTPTERKKLGDDLGFVMEKMNEMGVNPRMDKGDLLKAIDLVKSELEKSPNAAPRTPSENKQLMDALTALFGMDPSTPGKITGPIQCMLGNALGVADAFPALGAEPIHGYSGDILNASMQAATGAYSLEEDRDNDLGVTFADNDNGKDPSALEIAPTNDKEAPTNDKEAATPEPSAAEALTTAFASIVESSAKETSAAAEKNQANKDDQYKTRTPFDNKNTGPKPPTSVS